MDSEEKKALSCAAVTGLFPDELLEGLRAAHDEFPGELYLTGGTVRDLLLGRRPADIDLTVVRRAKRWADRLASLLGGTYVELGREEDAARLVWKSMIVDFSSFREGAASIEEELHRRDITINSMAVPVHDLLHDPTCSQHGPLPIIDPVNGASDLEEKLVRVTSRSSFASDPLRMLRVFRFAAVLDFAVDPETFRQVHLHRQDIERVSPERVAHELDLIVASANPSRVFADLAATGLLWVVLPELQPGVGMDQPASHHLDVFDHSLETLRWMEQVVARPAEFFPAQALIMEQYLQTGKRPLQMKWAALFHDIGKPATFGINEDKGGRITFYNHDLQGADIFEGLARRLRWSRVDSAVVARLITSHMRPFFLANNQRSNTLTLKACLRLITAMAEHLPGLFLLAMADALAGKGEGSPREIEQEVAGLFARLVQVEQENVQPVRSAPPLITGNDLIEELHLAPGPEFRRILDLVEEAHMEGVISSRSQALALAGKEAARRQSENLKP